MLYSWMKTEGTKEVEVEGADEGCLRKKDDK